VVVVFNVVSIVVFVIVVVVTVIVSFIGIVVSTVVIADVSFSGFEKFSGIVVEIVDDVSGSIVDVSFIVVERFSTIEVSKVVVDTELVENIDSKVVVVVDVVKFPSSGRVLVVEKIDVLVKFNSGSIGVSIVLSVT